jgi:hypothetical protein
MIKKVIKLVIDKSGAAKNVKDLDESIKGVADTAERGGKEATKSIDKVGKSAKSAGTAGKLASKGMSAIGTAIKGLGLGIVLGLFALFAKVLSENQKVADFFSVAIGTISNVFREVTTAVFNAFKSVSQATGGFDKLGKVLSGILTLTLTPFKLAFSGIKLALQEAQLAWEKSFFGDKDQETIKTLNASIKQTQAEILKATTEAVAAGFKIKDNFVGAISEVGSLANAVSTNIGKVSLEAAFEQAKTSKDLQNNAILSAARLQGLIEKFDVLAETQRRIRDDDRLSIEQRIAANEELGKVLDEQEKAQKAQAGFRVAAAADEVRRTNGNIEAQRELIEAQNELIAIEAQVGGFRAEQETNLNSLLRERKDILGELGKIGRTEIELAKDEAAQLRDDRLAQIALQVEDILERDRLIIAAKQDFDNKIKEIDQAEALRVKEAAEKKEAADEKVAKDKKDLEDAVTNSRIQSLNNLSTVAQGLEALAGKRTVASKALAVATTLVDTYQSATAAFKAQQTLATPDAPIRGAIAAAAAVAAGLANVKQILSVKVAGQGGGSGGNTATATATQQPSFNLVGRSNVNQLRTGLDEQDTPPVRAFVVGQDVTSQQAADRSTRSQAAFG